MNYYIKGLKCLSLLLLIFFSSFNTFAIEISAIYFSSCKREVGIVVDVKQHFIKMLNLDGRLLEIPRYDIIAMSSYPSDLLPVVFHDDADKTLKPVNYFKIKTMYKSEIITAVEGWPIQFSKENVSFLTLNGTETLIRRDDIWDIEIDETVLPKFDKVNVIKSYKYLHPSSLISCPNKVFGINEKSSTHISIPPQEYISDSVKIKNKLDKYSSEIDTLYSYYRSQKFYAVPRVYKNKSSLGFWGMLGSRYGKGDHREMNGFPILENEFSMGPFGYQHILYSGASPNSMTIHGEIQTQFFYSFKADYLHASAFVDPHLLLVGKKYNWSNADVPVMEDKMVEDSFFELGVDLYNFSLNFIPVSRLQYGVNITGNTESRRMNLPRYGLTYMDGILKAQFLFGNKKLDDHLNNYEIWIKRLNLEFLFREKYHLTYSLILRNSDVTPVNGSAKFESDSITNSIISKYDFNYKYSAGALLGVEIYKTTTDGSTVYPKLALNGAIKF